MFTASFIEFGPTAYTASIRSASLRKYIQRGTVLKRCNVGFKQGMLYFAWPTGHGSSRILPVPLKDIEDWKATAGVILMIARDFTVQIGRPQMDLWQYYRTHEDVSLKSYLKMEFGLVSYPDQATPFVYKLEKIVPQSTLSGNEFVAKIKILGGDES